MTTLLLAEQIAREAHAGQIDTVNGDPYIRHVERVVSLVEGDDAKAVAWLHDVIEDSDIGSEDLTKRGVPLKIVDAVMLLTRDPLRPYAGYIEDIRSSDSYLAITVKLADLRDHLRPNCPGRLRPRFAATVQPCCVIRHRYETLSGALADGGSPL